MITIENDGPHLVRTNYWDSAPAQRGYCYLSWNAGCGRLLLPDAMAGDVREMQPAQYVIVSRGPWAGQGGREGIELLFEDRSDSPYCLHLSVEQSDRLLPDADQGGNFSVAVWTRAGLQITLPGKYRHVAAIPCLDPWVEQ
ncbi:hypothetical protein [Pseudothauera rhizosphaerae]|uniref:Uncharacterized protein n=1 Tax=Pseudothauera rhizosphaerae TaxID=2565932 RepID=A0A4S4AWC3_9RHOO|nr:hypothetical protein [Pseudothauera rhizosphaerae]THF64330.1 hypothetical protein E6O51_03195 [Pseudothauera rhizosphaerae]